MDKKTKLYFVCWVLAATAISVGKHLYNGQEITLGLIIGLLFTQTVLCAIGGSAYLGARKLYRKHKAGSPDTGDRPYAPD